LPFRVDLRLFFRNPCLFFMSVLFRRLSGHFPDWAIECLHFRLSGMSPQKTLFFWVTSLTIVVVSIFSSISLLFFSPEHDDGRNLCLCPFFFYLFFVRTFFFFCILRIANLCIDSLPCQTVYPPAVCSFRRESNQLCSPVKLIGFPDAVFLF